jgi:hypothetical protein
LYINVIGWADLVQPNLFVVQLIMHLQVDNITYYKYNIKIIIQSLLHMKQLLEAINRGILNGLNENNIELLADLDGDNLG